MKYNMHRTIKQLATGITPVKRKKNRRDRSRDSDNKNNRR